MMPLPRLCAQAALLLSLLAAPAPLLANMYDGLDNDGDNQIDEPDEYDGGGNDMGRLEQECIATARAEVCLTSHTMFCQQMGIPGACTLMQIGNNCYGGDPGQCQYYQALMQANSACAMGDPGACQWLGAQPAWQGIGR